MGFRLLIYGATGFSGSLIAAEAVRLLRTEWSGEGHEVVLAARERTRLARLGLDLGLPYRSFGLDSAALIERSIRGFDVVLNAAGPFAFTAQPLVRACILTGVHYVDICGEIEVYKALDDMAPSARDREVALVCGAGYSATLSDVLLRAALKQIGDRDLGNVHIAVSSFAEFSRGSAAVMLRAMREQATVVAAGKPAGPIGAELQVMRGEAASDRTLRVSHVPIGRIQEVFDFGPLVAGRTIADRRVTSAANLIDTLVAKRCLEDFYADDPGPLPDRVISFIEMNMPMRVIYQVGAWAAPIYGQSWARRLLKVPLSFLPEGPPADERATHRRRLVLHIDDRLGDRLIDWRLETPDVYEVTARCALSVAAKVARTEQFGWLTPGSFIEAVTERAVASSARFVDFAMTDCVLEVASPE